MRNKRSIVAFATGAIVGIAVILLLLIAQYKASCKALIDAEGERNKSIKTSRDAERNLRKAKEELEAIKNKNENEDIVN